MYTLKKKKEEDHVGAVIVKLLGFALWTNVAIPRLDVRLGCHGSPATVDQ